MNLNAERSDVADYLYCAIDNLTCNNVCKYISKNSKVNSNNVNAEKSEDADNLLCVNKSLTSNNIFTDISKKSFEEVKNLAPHDNSHLYDYKSNDNSNPYDNYEDPPHLDETLLRNCNNIAKVHNDIVENCKIHDDTSYVNTKLKRKTLCPPTNYEFIKNRNEQENAEVNDKMSSNSQGKSKSQEVVNNFKIQFLNLGGLSSKLKFPDIYDFVNNADVTGLVETKLKTTDVNINDKGVDVNTFPGFHCFHKFRCTKSSKPSGGICFVVKDDIKDFFQLLNCNNPDMSFGKITIPNCEPLVLSLVYISPENSPYSSRQTFIDIENEICNTIIREPNILILGDFNAYTSNKCDLNIILDKDSFLFTNSNFFEPESNTGILNEMNMPIQRKSQCKHKINNYGNCLLDLVKNLNMIICNGRFGPLSECVTTPSQSVIDYCIGSPNVLKHIQNFKVLDFSRIISDVHCGLEIHISTTFLTSRNIAPFLENTPTTPVDVIEQDEVDYDPLQTAGARKWEHDKADEYFKNICIEDIEKIHLLLEQPGPTDKNIDESVEKVCTSLQKLLIEAGITTFGKKNKTKDTKFKPQQQKKNKPAKPYFDEKCKHSRYLFMKARKKYKALKSINNLTNMRNLGKLYKKQVMRSHRNYVKSLSSELRKLKKGGNQKEYWKLLNKGKEPQNRQKNNCTHNDLFEYFKKLNTDENSILEIEEKQQQECLLDEPIHQEEINCCIKRLKADKASGLDGISNEYIKSTKSLLLPIYTKLFNIIYDTGKFPNSWSVGVIKPIFKNKGDSKVPSNYRPICILSCLGKLFTMVLNERLKLYSESQSVIGEEQMGFRKGYSTTDGVYVLQTLIDLFASKNKNLYAAFIDLERAFPSISRQILFKKLSDINIGQKMYTCIKNMYTNIKSCVFVNNKYSPMFPCEVGLREGESLSPILFSFYMNDLYRYLDEKCNNVPVVDYECDQVTYYLRTFLLMYADDTILLSESKKGLQELLNAYTCYCNNNRLRVNVQKTKIVVFGRSTRKPKCYIGNEELEVMSNFKYLGITISNKGRYTSSIKDNVNKARKAFFAQMRHVKENKLPLSTHIELFLKAVDPILLFGAEIWGFENLASLEIFRIRCLKTILHLKTSTPDYMIYGELGILPLEHDVKIRMINYWSKLLNEKGEKLSAILYRIAKMKETMGQCNSRWNQFIGKILGEAGFGYLWLMTNPEKEIIRRKNEIKQRISCIYLQNLKAEGASPSVKKAQYIWLKDDWTQEKYLEKLDYPIVAYLLKFRTDNHKLPVEIGRYQNIEFKNRLCPKCEKDVGDKYHYLFSCPAFNSERLSLIPQKYRVNHNMYKYKTLLGNANTKVLKNLGKFIKHVMNSF